MEYKFSVGDYVKVVQDATYHGLPIGSVSKIVYRDTFGNGSAYQLRNNKFVLEHEVELVGGILDAYSLFRLELLELVSELPDEFKEYVEKVSYERGHSAGYDEVLSIAKGMVYDLKLVVDKYTTRILSSDHLINNM